MSLPDYGVTPTDTRRSSSCRDDGMTHREHSAVVMNLALAIADDVARSEVESFAAGGGTAGASGGSVLSAQGGRPAMQANGVDIGQIGGVVVNRQGMQAFAGKAMPWMAAISGATYGWNQSGDTAGKVMGAAAYGTAAFAGAAAVSAGAGALAAGGGLAAVGSAALAAIPVVGWIALAAIAIDKISGGKLFGTKFKPESAFQQCGRRRSDRCGHRLCGHWLRIDYGYLLAGHLRGIGDRRHDTAPVGMTTC